LQQEQQSKQNVRQGSALLEANPQLKLANGVYLNIDTQIRESAFSNYVRQTVSDSYDSCSDLSLFSVDIEEVLLTDEIRTALSPAPFNFLLSFDLKGMGHTLDLTQDFGGVSHFLADKVNSIDSVKIDIAQAHLSAKRCASYNNITYISEDISELVLTENNYDLIIVSQLEDLNLNKQEQIDLLKKLQLALSKTGRLVVTVRNRDRLTKWTSLGSGKTAYQALYQNETVSDFTLAELETAFKGAGFLHWDSYANFSQGRAIQNLLSREYLTTNAHSLNHFNRLGGIDNNKLNEYLLFKNLYEERGQVFDLASHFIVVAGVSATRSQQLCNTSFAHFSGIGRKPQWRTTTECKKGSDKVTKTSLHPNFVNANNSNSNIKLSQTTATQEFKNGNLLLDDWLSALLADSPSTRLKELIAEYSLWLSELEKNGGLDSKAYDVLPFNIIVNQQDKERVFNIIDPEWLVETEFNKDFILFRALFWFAFENKPLLKELAEQTGLLTIGLFVLHHMGSLDSLEQLGQFVEMEEEIQRQIGMNFRNKSIEYALLQTFDGEPLQERLQPACQISWSDDAGVVDEHNSVFILWKSSEQEQILKSTSPSFVEGKNVLRLDPVASMALFKFSSLKLIAKDNTVVWQLNSAAEIANTSKSLNVSLVENTNSEHHFVALNEDPHFLFDLSKVKNLDIIEKIEVTFALLHNQYYDSSLAALSRAVGEQNTALFQQVGILDTKQAQIETLSAKLEHTEQHRQALHLRVHEIQQAHEEHINNLRLSLETQVERFQQLRNNPIVRIILKAKRFFSKLISKVFSRP